YLIQSGAVVIYRVLDFVRIFSSQKIPNFLSLYVYAITMSSFLPMCKGMAYITSTSNKPT
ncbi:hypothetical protein GIB67_014248, partial [Kingdonia uniflora]